MQHVLGWIRAITASVALIAVVVAIGSCVTGGVTDLVYSDAKGNPLDWAGMHMRCRDPDCGGQLKWQRDYDYQCDRCGARTTARRRGMQVEFGGRY